MINVIICVIFGALLVYLSDRVNRLVKLYGAVKVLLDKHTKAIGGIVEQTNTGFKICTHNVKEANEFTKLLRDATLGEFKKVEKAINRLGNNQMGANENETIH